VTTTLRRHEARLSSVLGEILEIERVSERTASTANASDVTGKTGRSAVKGGEALLGAVTVNVVPATV
jgi:hypothetical protein